MPTDNGSSITKLGMNRVDITFVLRILIADHKQNNELAQAVTADPTFLSRIIAADES